ncbi:MAG TPA: hypothetical protein VHE33_15115 [Acidobacteriaceae bacterium]|nr:hypothetical protein [Acidobacteriaceae bacterium]
MTNVASSKIEAGLAAAIREFLSAEPNQFISEDENLREVCRWLARFTQELLNGKDDWGRYAWVDDISPCTAKGQPSGTFVLTALMIWVADDKKSPDWKEPLFAEMHLSASSPPRLEYEIRVGDADCGLAKCPYSSLHEYPVVAVENWLFTFDSKHTNE